MKLFISIVLFSLYHTIRISPLDRSEVKSDNIGSHIYNTLVVTQSMKRPNKKWFLNVFNLKPNDKYFSEAQYNGLRYQTELLQDNINKNWFFNVFSLKPSEKYFQNAQYNGLRYQTELLRENINNNYNDIKNDIYKAKLDAIENKLLIQSKLNNNK